MRSGALGQAMFTKCIVVVDEDCDVQDVGEVMLRAGNNIDPERDIQFTMGPVDSLDHASRLPNYGVEDGDRCDAEVGGGRVYPAVAADVDDAGSGEGSSGEYLRRAGNQIELAELRESVGPVQMPALRPNGGRAMSVGY
jgi:hypothetical protein